MYNTIQMCLNLKTNKFASFQAQQQQAQQQQARQQPDFNNLSHLLGGVAQEVSLMTNLPIINLQTQLNAMHTQLNAIQTTFDRFNIILDRMNTMLQAL